MWLIIKKRILLNIFSLRFIILTILLVVCISIGTLVLLGRYQMEKELYEAAEDRAATVRYYARMYGQLHLYLNRPVEQLSLISTGYTDEFGSSIKIPGEFAGRMSITKYSSHYSLSPLFGYLDLGKIIAVLISFIAIIITYDSVTGQKENRTLSLCFSHSLARYKVILGEYLGAILTLIIPLLMSFIILELILVSSRKIDLNAEDFLRLNFSFLLSVVFISVFALLGVSISYLFHSSANSLSLLLLLWIVLLLIIPNFSSYIAERYHPIPEIEKPIIGEGSEKPPANLWDMLYINEKVQQYNVRNSLSFLSPFMAYQSGLESLSNTSLPSYLKFIRQAQNLNETFALWQAEKLKTSPRRLMYWSTGDEPLDTSGIPHVEYKKSSLLASLTESLKGLVILISWNVILLLLSLYNFNRYDLR
ncbi:hypothetical protein CEE39_00220 [bacterium (candidate division B38) B3_B38]|nr:MAG: hypothetical protein CEE39_00220 [bacterium (candidate division B38) B3_B38]